MNLKQLHEERNGLGLHMNRLPYGYVLSPDKKILIDKKKANIVLYIFECSANGYLPGQILKAIKKYLKFDISFTRIDYIKHNPIYIGYYRKQEYYVKATNIPILVGKSFFDSNKDINIFECFKKVNPETYAEIFGE